MDLADAGLFTADLFGPNAERPDFNFDGTVGGFEMMRWIPYPEQVDSGCPVPARVQPRGIALKFPFVLVVTLLGLPLLALADGGPDPELSTVTIAYPGPEPVMLMVMPDGSGPTFSAGYVTGGVVVDVTVTLTLYDYGGYPIADFPAEDIWLQGLAGGLVPCAGGPGLLPDRNTDSNGRTVWNAAPRAGGHTTGLALVYVNGGAIANSAGLNLTFTSPDINGDGQISLTDGGLFTHDLFNPYVARSDFNLDGVVNIGDAGRLMNSVGHGCP